MRKSDVKIKRLDEIRKEHNLSYGLVSEIQYLMNYNEIGKKLADVCTSEDIESDWWMPVLERLRNINDEDFFDIIVGYIADTILDWENILAYIDGYMDITEEQ